MMPREEKFYENGKSSRNERERERRTTPRPGKRKDVCESSEQGNSLCSLAKPRILARALGR